MLVLGVALSADAFAVTISNSFVYSGERMRRLALMPLLGHVLGGLAAGVIERYSGVVLMSIGLKAFLS